MEELKDLHA